MILVDLLIGILAFLLGLLVREFLPGYVRKKGENLATKEDISEITRRQEDIKHQFNVLIEESKQKHALRTIVADKRLEAHQGAFKRVKQLLSAGRETTPIDEVGTWMDDNCLYLSAGARQAVWSAIGHAKARALMLNELDKDVLELKHRLKIEENEHGNFKAIISALKPVVDGVDVPALGDDELQSIAANAQR
jgi:hypothetical protein